MRVARFSLTAASTAVLLIMLSTEASATRIKGALERYERSSLKLMFISPPRMDGSRFAYIHDTDGYSHRVEAGDYLGKQDGKVLEIRAREIVVGEIVKQGADYVEKNVAMKCAQFSACDEAVASPSIAECENLASSGVVPEHCAIEFAKREIVKRHGKLEYTQFGATYDADTESWVVVGAAGHVHVSVRSDGKIGDYKLSR